jgi:hypothetical protein
LPPAWLHASRAQGISIARFSVARILTSLPGKPAI